MVAISFSEERFIYLILRREKDQTIRPFSDKRYRQIKKAKRLQLYYKQRTKDCRKIADAELVEIFKIKMNFCPVKTLSIKILDGDFEREVTEGERQCIITRDGFSNDEEFYSFFHEKYGDKIYEMEFMVIRWKLCEDTVCPFCDALIGLGEEHKDIAGKLYCDYSMRLLKDDIVKILQNDYSLNVSSAEVSKWIDDYVKKNLHSMTQKQKKMLLVKKVIESYGRNVADIVEMIKEKWGYHITHIRILNLVSSYKKIKEREDDIENMLENGIRISSIADYLKIDRDMLLFIYGGNRDDK